MFYTHILKSDFFQELLRVVADPAKENVDDNWVIFVTGQMAFLLPRQRCWSTEGNSAL